MKSLHLLAATLFATSCIAPAQLVHFELEGAGGSGLLPANEVPPAANGTPGSGGIGPGGIVLDTASNTLVIDVQWGSAKGFTDLTGDATLMHIHGPTSPAPAGYGENAGVVTTLHTLAGFQGSATSGGFNAAVVLTDAQETALLEGRYYLNVHTALNGGGEIRGQLVQGALTEDGAPNAGSPCLVAWFDAGDAATLFADTAGTTPASDGGLVARWDDKSRSGLSVQQSGPTNSPSFTQAVAGLNDLPAVSFVGGSGGDALTSTTGNSTGIAGAGPLTMVSVWKTTGFTGQNFQHSVHLGNIACNEAYGHSVSRAGNGGEVGNHYWCDGFNTFKRIENGESAFAISTYDGVTDQWHVNGAPVGRRDVALNIGASQLHLGSRLDPFIEGFTGDLAEVMIFNKALDDDQIAALSRHLSDKFGIAIDEPLQAPEPGGVDLATGRPIAAHPNLKFWLDSSDISTLWQDTAGTIPAADGQPVARWDDKSSNGIVVTQPSAANTPSYAASVPDFSGAPGVLFGGGDGGDALSSTTGNSTGINGLDSFCSVVTVWQTTGFTGQNHQHTFHMGTPEALQAYGHSVSRGDNLGQIGNHYWADAYNSSATADTTAAHMAVSTYDLLVSEDSWWVDGTPAGTRSVGLNIGTGELQIGSRLQPFTEGFTGNLAEVIVFCHVLTGEERDALGFYIQGKYGIPVEGAAVSAGDLQITEIRYEVDADLPDTVHVTIKWPASQGVSYKVEGSNDLMTQPWEDLNDFAQAQPGEDCAEFTETIAGASGVPRRFYRVRPNPMP